MFRLLIAFALLLFSSNAFSQADQMGPPAPQALETTAKMQSAANSTILPNATTQSTMEKVCGTQFGAWACPIAQAAAASIVVNAVMGEDAGKTGQQFDSSTIDFSDPNATNPGGLTNQQITQYVDDAKKTLKKMEKKTGLKFNKDGSVSKDGKTFPGSTLNSGKAMADAGLIDPDAAGLYDKGVSDHKKRLNKFSIKAQNARGGYKAKRKRNPSSADYSSAYNFGFGEKPQIKAAQTSGLSKDFGGTPIGVASDDLFKMISTRYNLLAEDSQFIDNDAGSYPGQK